MIYSLRALPELLRVGFAASVAYRAEMVIWILTTTLPLVMLALWNAVAAGGPVGGYGQTEFARYFVATLIVRQLTGVWVFWELNFLIRSGGLSAKLLRPLHPLWISAANTLAAIPLRIVVLVPLVGVVILWRPELVALPSPPIWLLFATSVALAWTLSFLVQALFGMLAFWLDQADGLFGLFFAIWGLLSGYTVPLSLFPEALQPLIRILPFRAMLAVPVELLGGFLSPADALPALGLQLLWTGLALLATRLVWRRGLAQYGAFGS